MYFPSIQNMQCLSWFSLNKLQPTTPYTEWSFSLFGGSSRTSSGLWTLPPPVPPSLRFGALEPPVSALPSPRGRQAHEFHQRLSELRHRTAGHGFLVRSGAQRAQHGPVVRRGGGPGNQVPQRRYVGVYPTISIKWMMMLSKGLLRDYTNTIKHIKIVAICVYRLLQAMGQTQDILMTCALGVRMCRWSSLVVWMRKRHAR